MMVKTWVVVALGLCEASKAFAFTAVVTVTVKGAV